MTSTTLGESATSDAKHDLDVVHGAVCNGIGQELGVHNSNTARLIHGYWVVSSNMGGSPSPEEGLIGPGQTRWIVCSAGVTGQVLSVEVTGGFYVDGEPQRG